MDLIIDANNNSSEKCYSLRPRAAPKKDEDDSDQDEGSRPSGRKKKKSKQKPGRLSKYRRKTANARERSRMREINEAFEALRRAIPHLTPCNDSAGEKLTKISTLRLAMKYITALSNALSDSPGESDGESFFSDYSLPPSEPRDHSMTPSSVSDHSDFYDQFFQKSLSGNLSPCETVALGAPSELSFSGNDCDPAFNRSENSSNFRTLTKNPNGAPLGPLPSFYQVSTSIRGPEVCERLPPSYQPQQLPCTPETVFRNSLTSNDLQEPTTSSDLDSILYPSLNFDELFIT